jgi:hypothetical protein
VADRIIFNGEPGERWRNDTEKPKFQFVCQLSNTCGACLQYHMAIGDWWPIPIHRNCRCKQQLVRPGGEAPHAFVDFREVLDDLSPAQQREAVGAANYRLLKAGRVEWKDVVGKYRVRTLTEVVARKDLTVEQMTAAGVKPHFAEAAHAAIHTPEAELIRRQRAELTEKILKAGVSREQLVKELAKRVVVTGPAPFQTVAGMLGDQELHAVLFRQHLAEIAARIRPPVGSFAEQVQRATERAGPREDSTEPEWMRRLYEAHQADSANPRMTFRQFKREMEGPER